MEEVCCTGLVQGYQGIIIRALNLWRRNRELREKHPIVTILAPYRLQEFRRAFNHHFKNEFWNINCPAGVSNTLLHHQIKGLALAQCPVFSLSMQIFLLSDSLSYPQRVSYYLTLFHTGLTYYFHDIGYPIIYPIVTFAYRKVKKYPINNSSYYPICLYKGNIDTRGRVKIPTKQKAIGWIFSLIQFW